MIKYEVGNVVESKVEGLKVLTHIVNSAGAWGSGVVVPIGKKWPHVKNAYHDWYNSTLHACDFYDVDVPWLLGEVQFVQADDEFIVANMLAQKCPGVCENINGTAWPPIRLEALEECMGRVADFARDRKATIVAPWFGCLRAGSSREVIEPMIKSIWRNCEVVMYEFKE